MNYKVTCSNPFAESDENDELVCIIEGEIVLGSDGYLRIGEKQIAYLNRPGEYLIDAPHPEDGYGEVSEIRIEPLLRSPKLREPTVNKPHDGDTGFAPLVNE